MGSLVLNPIIELGYWVRPSSCTIIDDNIGLIVEGEFMLISTVSGKKVFSYHTTEDRICGICSGGIFISPLLPSDSIEYIPYNNGPSTYVNLMLINQPLIAVTDTRGLRAIHYDNVSDSISVETIADSTVVSYAIPLSINAIINCAMRYKDRDVIVFTLGTDITIWDFENNVHWKHTRPDEYVHIGFSTPEVMIELDKVLPYPEYELLLEPKGTVYYGDTYRLTSVRLDLEYHPSTGDSRYFGLDNNGQRWNIIYGNHSSMDNCIFIPSDRMGKFLVIDFIGNKMSLVDLSTLKSIELRRFASSWLSKFSIKLNDVPPSLIDSVPYIKVKEDDYTYDYPSNYLEAELLHYFPVGSIRPVLLCCAVYEGYKILVLSVDEDDRYRIIRIDDDDTLAIRYEHIDEPADYVSIEDGELVTMEPEEGVAIIPVHNGFCIIRHNNGRYEVHNTINDNVVNYDHLPYIEPDDTDPNGWSTSSSVPQIRNNSISISGRSVIIGTSDYVSKIPCSKKDYYVALDSSNMVTIFKLE